jgi:glycogenin glucosyltransferase
MESHGKWSQALVLKQATGTEDLESAPNRSMRRESLILTDFPSAFERPSLPVTPAPISRPSFWGGERDDTGDLPAAEGVEDQSEWVCPHCGFSSLDASDFRPSRAFQASSTTAVSPDSFVTSPVIPMSSFSSYKMVQTIRGVGVPQAKPHGAFLAHTDTEAAPQNPSLRGGLSASGCPLASLTYPAALAP